MSQNKSEYISPCRIQLLDKVIFLSAHSDIEKITGYSAEKLKIEEYLYESRIHPDGREERIKAIFKAADQLGSYQVEYPLDHADGSIRYILEKGQIELEGSEAWINITLIDIAHLYKVDDTDAYKTISLTYYELSCRLEQISELYQNILDIKKNIENRESRLTDERVIFSNQINRKSNQIQQLIQHKNQLINYLINDIKPLIPPLLVISSFLNDSILDPNTKERIFPLNSCIENLVNHIDNLIQYGKIIQISKIDDYQIFFLHDIINATISDYSI